MSGLGKGTAISCLGVVLRARGYCVTSIKIDPYLNVDAGTMSPFEHGEVYVLDDGGEADLDLGNYERFLGCTLTSKHNITSGKIYEKVIRRERTGDYLGKTVQMIPHVTDAVQDWISEVSQIPVDGSSTQPDICLIELGGTVGDIESAVYLEALQQLQYRVGLENVCMIHVGLVPVMGVVGEQKTKPCQHSVKLLREAGIKPDFLFCRSEQPLEESVRRKLSVFCQVPSQQVVSLHDVSNIYRVPLLLEDQGVGLLVLTRLGLQPEKEVIMPGVSLIDWRVMADRTDSVTRKCKIAIVGKYTGLSDAYLSVVKGIKHAALEAGVDAEICWVDATDLCNACSPGWSVLEAVDGVLVPGGFGDRGVEGKIAVSRFCREKDIPYFGICLGLQTAVIGFARDTLKWADANSEEFAPNSPHPVVKFMPEGSTTVMGGTMRLGARVTSLRSGTLAWKLYGGKESVSERHRHRYEVNPEYIKMIENEGMVFSGVDQGEQVRMEIAEIPHQKFFLAAQFHPEFTSRPRTPNPLFLGFVLASAGILSERLQLDGGVLQVGTGWTR